VIHHGGAGTTSAGLRAGNPTGICPFFGDQHFWAEMVFRAGAGPPGCPIAQLTAEKLTESFRTLKAPQTRQNVAELAVKMNSENGVLNGISSFFRNLPLPNMLCMVSQIQGVSALANVRCKVCGLHLSSTVDAFVHGISPEMAAHRRVPHK
jgi:hypothetical protein